MRQPKADKADIRTHAGRHEQTQGPHRKEIRTAYRYRKRHYATKRKDMVAMPLRLRE